MCITGVGNGSFSYIQLENSNVIFPALYITLYSTVRYYLQFTPAYEKQYCLLEHFNIINYMKTFLIR